MNRIHEKKHLPSLQGLELREAAFLASPFEKLAKSLLLVALCFTTPWISCNQVPDYRATCFTPVSTVRSRIELCAGPTVWGAEAWPRPHNDPERSPPRRGPRPESASRSRTFPGHRFPQFALGSARCTEFFCGRDARG